MLSMGGSQGSIILCLLLRYEMIIIIIRNEQTYIFGEYSEISAQRVSSAWHTFRCGYTNVEKYSKQDEMSVKMLRPSLWIFTEEGDF